MADNMKNKQQGGQQGQQSGQGQNPGQGQHSGQPGQQSGQPGQQKKGGQSNDDLENEHQDRHRRAS